MLEELGAAMCKVTSRKGAVRWRSGSDNPSVSINR